MEKIDQTEISLKGKVYFYLNVVVHEGGGKRHLVALLERRHANVRTTRATERITQIALQ